MRYSCEAYHLDFGQSKGSHDRQDEHDGHKESMERHKVTTHFDDVE